MLALVIAPEGQAALIGGFFGVLVALVPVITSARRSKRVESKLGEPNGHGTVVEMLAELLTQQKAQGQAIADLRLRQREHEGTMMVLARKVEIWGRTMLAKEGAPTADGDGGSGIRVRDAS